MTIPFSVDLFLEVFERYNLAVWPMQVFLTLLGIAAVVLAVRKPGYSSRAVAIALAILWFWIGVVYHILFFTAINKTAYGFGALFALQGVLFLVAGVLRQDLSFHYSTNIWGILGGALILYAMVIYPLLGHALGHAYPKAPTFGLPCPTAIFTFGLLLWTDRKVPRYVLVVPLLWSLIGFSAAVSLGMAEDFGLVVAGVSSTILILWRDRGNKELSWG